MLGISYDSGTDSLYLYLAGTIRPGEARWQLPFDGEHADLAGFIADLSTDGKILGIEVLDASERVFWQGLSTSPEPSVIKTYAGDHDEVKISFGGTAITTFRVADQKFPQFLMQVGVDGLGKVTEIVIPQASRQLPATSLQR
jgi:uncharacterized protein YuzE